MHIPMNLIPHSIYISEDLQTPNTFYLKNKKTNTKNQTNPPHFLPVWNA